MNRVEIFCEIIEYVTLRLSYQEFFNFNLLRSILIGTKQLCAWCILGLNKQTVKRTCLTKMR